MSSSGPEAWVDRFLKHLGEHERSREPRPGAQPLLPEDQLKLPRYDLRGRLGEGTSAVVYQAWDRELGRLVALKVLRPSLDRADILRQRFRREAQSGASIDHPNVVAVHDVGEVEGRLFLVMELVEGQSLATLFQERAADLEGFVRILEKAARGVAAAHDKGIVHRDLKPANILVSSRGEPKVGDFGLAHWESSSGELTRSGSALGTPLYMSPEQVGGRPEEITPRTDVYALGAILYEALTGQPVHVAETIAEIYRKILLESPVEPRRRVPSTPKELETIALKALRKEPAGRYATAAEFADDLRRYLAGEPVTARRASPVERLWLRAVRSRRLLLPLGAAVAIGLAIGVATQQPKGRPAATVESVQGDVSLVGPAGRTLVREGMRVNEGEGLETGPPPGRIAIRLSDGTRLEAGPGTFLRGLAGGSAGIVRGTVRVDSRQGSTDPPFLLTTPQVEIRSSRGVFGATVDETWTRVESTSGAVGLRRARGGPWTEIPAGSVVRVSLEGGAIEPAPLNERILRVGPGREFGRPSEAAAAATDGSVVEIDAGLYEGDDSVWNAGHLTLRGVGGRVRVKAGLLRKDGTPSWHLKGRDVLIENVEFLGDSTGTGVWCDAPGVTIRNCVFSGNSRALGGKALPDSDLVVEHTEFVGNGRADGHSANFNCPEIRSLTLRYCWIHDPRSGHQVTSHASTNYILYNRVSDENRPSSRCLDLPEGGTSVVIGNLLRRGPAAGGGNVVSFGFDPSPAPQRTLIFVNNTVVSEKTEDSFIYVGSDAAALRITNNIFVGKMPILNRASELRSNLVGRDPHFVDPSAFDFRLRAGSPAIDAGVDAGTEAGFDLNPRFQYAHPAGKVPRPVQGPIDLGAFEFVR